LKDKEDEGMLEKDKEKSIELMTTDSREKKFEENKNKGKSNLSS